MDAPGLWKTLGFQISGAAQASYTQNFNSPNTNLNQLRIFDTQSNSFRPTCSSSWWNGLQRMAVPRIG